MGKVQIKVAKNKFLCEITPTILPTLANLELLKKFLEYKIDNLPEAKPISKSLRAEFFEKIEPLKIKLSCLYFEDEVRKIKLAMN